METRFVEIISAAMQLRKVTFGSAETNAFRLFNGFLEGYPDLVLELFARTLLIYDYSPLANLDLASCVQIEEICRREFPVVDSCVLKRRFSPDANLNRGILLSGNSSADHIIEYGVNYAVSLQYHQDSSFYCDTRFLRAWLKQAMQAKSVLNTFAYCGSLGVAALTGSAKRVVQTDANSDFLQVAQKSTSLNGFQPAGRDFITADFFKIIAQMKQRGLLFDCVIIDPPFFAKSKAGIVDLLTAGERLVNKVRPLVGHNGYMVIVNNALFLSGTDFYASLQKMFQNGYLSLERIISVPEDVCGYPQTIRSTPPVDPAPFNHSTKIAIVKVTRKDECLSNVE